MSLIETSGYVYKLATVKNYITLIYYVKITIHDHPRLVLDFKNGTLNMAKYSVNWGGKCVATR